MKDQHIAKVMNVWASENKIIRPLKKELLLEIIDQIASLFSVGLFYYYIVNFENLEMEMVHKGTQEILGLNPQEFNIKKLLDIMHPDDIASMANKERTAVEFLLKTIPTEDIPLYKVVYMFRLRDSKGVYKKILHQAKALTVSEDGKIQQVLGIHTDISHLNIPLNENISFISSKRPSYYSLETSGPLNLQKISYKELFSKREKEIIKKISDGFNFNEIAQDLYLSPHTINTHKKNILKKSGCKNTPELITKCIIEGVI